MCLLGLALALAAGDSADPQARAVAKETQRHTASSGSATPTAAATTKAAEPPIVFSRTPDPAPAALARFYAARPVWEPCEDDDTFTCATVMVPVDYAKPAGATVALALRRLAAGKPGERRGSLFINPGGPGGSGTYFADDATSYFGDSVRDSWDIIGWDPRGMGESAGFDCLTDADLDAMYAADPTPPTASGQAALARASQARLDGCQRRGGALAAHMGTEDVARDLDIMRAVVGDERLNYYGVSYGTLIGSVYATLFTSRVGLMVLDSAVPPDGRDSGPITQEDADAGTNLWASEFDDRFAEFVDACNDGHPCFLGADPEAAAPKIVALLDSLQKKPLATDDTLPPLTEGWAVEAIADGLRDSGSWPVLVDSLEDAINDADGTGLASFAADWVGREVDGSYPGATFGKNHLPVTCADWPLTGWGTVKIDPTILAEHVLWSRIEPLGTPECLGWKGPTRKTLKIGGEPATPILLIGNQGDPVTPMDDTQHMATLLYRSRVATVIESDLHGAYASGNSCMDDIVDTYLVEAVPPDSGAVC